ncbi:MAG: hypothetical protein AB7F76_14710 [Parvibaculaceae bacterium]
MAKGSHWWAAAACAASLCLAPDAWAHSSDRGHVLLLPTGYYAVGGAIAVALSFIILAFVPAARLAALARDAIAIVPMPRHGRALISLLSFALLLVLVVAGLIGSRDPLSNPLPLVIWTLLWVGVTLTQSVAGDFWRGLNPWYGLYRLLRRDAAGPMTLPHRIGCWPAILFLFGFIWFELVYPAPEDPFSLALAVASYWLVTFVLMLLFGYESWTRSGEFLSIFFSMIARLSPFDGRSPMLRLGRPGAKLVTAEPLPLSGTLFILLALASVSFDGLSKTFFWLGLNGINPLEFPGRSAIIGIGTAGLLLTFMLLSAIYFAAIFIGERLSGAPRPLAEAAGLLVWSLIPIALAYHFSHYLVVFLVNLQYALVAASDPFALGWDLFGTAHLPIRAGIVAGAESAWIIWNAQAAAIILGHVLAVLIAHLLSVRLHGEERHATIAQSPLAILMVGYTVFGLWLLSTPTAG